jgi:glycolate oxidase FAD binding subunit
VLTGADLGPFVVDGRAPEAAVFPASVEELRAVVDVAGAAGVPVVPWGGGTAMAVGAPPRRAGLVVGLRRLDRLLEHEPGDLTATVQAGMTVAALQEALRPHGQWWSLDPPDAERATVGGVIAANAAGPRRQLYGTVRDLLLGVTVVTGEGAVVRGGGKVVKNVAGYDVPKLFVGSFGTLGILVEATVKLRPRPEAERLLALRFERLKDAGLAVRAVLSSDVIPSALELLDPEAARALAVQGVGPSGGLVVVGVDGLREQVEWQAEELDRLARALGARRAEPLPDELWARLATAARAAVPTLAAVMKLVVLPSAAADTMGQGTEAARARGLQSAWTAHAGVGVLTGVLGSAGGSPDPQAVAAVLQEWRAMARAAEGYAVVEWAPLAVKAQVSVWDEPGGAGRLMQRIKSRLDPLGLLNPGRFVAGI